MSGCRSAVGSASGDARGLVGIRTAGNGAAGDGLRAARGSMAGEPALETDDRRDFVGTSAGGFIAAVVVTASNAGVDGPDVGACAAASVAELAAACDVSDRSLSLGACEADRRGAGRRNVSAGISCAGGGGGSSGTLAQPVVGR